MRTWQLFFMLAALWLVAPAVVVTGLAPEAPSLVVMPLVALAAAWQAQSLRDAWLVPSLVMLLPGTYVLVTGLASDGLSLGLLDEALWVHMIHILPVVTVSLSLHWAVGQIQGRQGGSSGASARAQEDR